MSGWCQRLGQLVEDLFGAAVGKASLAGGGVEVGGGQGDAGAAHGEEHWSSRTAGQHLGEQGGKIQWQCNGGDIMADGTIRHRQTKAA